MRGFRKCDDGPHPIMPARTGIIFPDRINRWFTRTGLHQLDLAVRFDPRGCYLEETHVKACLARYARSAFGACGG